MIGSGYFANDSILPMEAILLSPFMCVYITIIATILVVMLWYVDSAAALKYNGYGFESSLARQLEKDSIYWRRGPGM